MIVQRKHYQEQKKERNIFMTKPGDLPANKKTIHELAKELPLAKSANSEQLEHVIKIAQSMNIFFIV